MGANFASGLEASAHMKALTLVIDERVRQIDQKGYTCAHDDQHGEEELAVAAAFFLMPAVYNEDVCTRDDEWLKVHPLLEVIGRNAWEGISRVADLELEYQENADALQYRIDVVKTGLALGLAELERLVRLQLVLVEVP